MRKSVALAVLAGLFVAGCGGGGGGEVAATKQAERVIADLAAAGGTQRQTPRPVVLAAAATNVLVNGNFENGTTGWSASDNVLGSGDKAHAGSGFAWLGGYDNALDRLSQTVTIPAGSSAASLQFWYRISTNETLPGAYDGMQLSVHDASGASLATLKLYTNEDATSGWTQSPAFDLSAFIGKTVDLRFTAVTDETQSSSFFLDDMTVSVTAAASVAVTMSGNRADATITRQGDSYVVEQKIPGSVRSMSRTFAAGERLNFADATVALDTTGVPAQVYRLYQAAFDRKPDAGGLGFHISSVEDSGLTLTQIAQNFINSPEFASLYGSNPTDEQFVTRLYQNVLHRAPDAGGLAWHLGNLRGGMARRDVLAFFSESPENVSNVAPAIAGGIAFTPLNRPTTPVTCASPKVMQNGLCVTPAPVCPANSVLRDGACVPIVTSCVAPAVLTNGVCVAPPPACQAPKVLQNGLCVTVATSCTAPKVLQDGVCVTPPPTPAPTCSAAQQLTNGVCVDKPTIPVTPLMGTVALERVLLGKLVA